jgi:hypothetical protein
MRRRSIEVVILTGLLAGLAGCQAAVPGAAQLVHLVASQSEVRLTPSNVQAGDVYIQLDQPLDGGSFIFVAANGPMSDNDLERLAHGDVQGTIQSTYGPSCSGSQGADVGHLAGPGVCGDVWKLTLVPGRYAILGPGWTQKQTEPSVAPTADPAGFKAPSTMAVLDVLP